MAARTPGRSQREAARTAMRARLMDAATRVMDEHGLAGTTIREIAKAAGVAEGSVYNHFESKIDLVSAVFVERMPKVALRVAIVELARQTGQGDARANLVEFARAAIDAYRELDLLAGSVAASPETQAALRERLTRLNIGPARGHSGLAAYLRIEEEQGRLRLTAPASVLAAALLGGCHEHAFLGVFYQTPPLGDPADYARDLVAALFPVPADNEQTLTQ